MEKILFINHSTWEKILNLIEKVRKLFPLIILTAVMLILYLGYREPVVNIDKTAFRLRGGLYGVNIPFVEISQVDTIVWNEMPVFIRTNGISLFLVNRGDFKTKDGDKIRLSMNGGGNLVIRIIDNHGKIYYINRKKAIETRQIYNELQKYL